MAPTAPVDHVALLGLMGSGKTTIGREVARRLGWRLVDSDEWVLERTGMTVAELWQRGGEAAYRPHEQAVVSETLAGPSSVVLTVPAGAVEDSISVAELRRPGVFRVWLRADVDTLVERVASSSHRPLLDDDPRSVLEAQAVGRGPTYEALADLVVDVDRIDAQAAATLVVDAVLAAGHRPAGG